MLVVLALVAFAVAFFDSRLGFSLIMGTVGALLLVLGIAFYLWATSIRQGVVRVDPESGALRFVPTRGVKWGWLSVALAGVAVATVALVVQLTGLLDVSVFGFGTNGDILIVGVVCLGGLIQQLWSLRVPLGLTVNSYGLRGVRGSKAVDVPWAQLAGVTLGERRGATLVLHILGSTPIEVDPRSIGSDPNLVAAIIGHYLHSRDQRGSLVDPREAVRRVEAAVDSTPH